MRLLHYSAKPLSRLRSVTFAAQRKHEGGVFKPVGLWVSVEGDDDWLAWCKAENWGTDRLSYVTEIKLPDTAHVLRLTNSAEIDRFHGAYAKPIYGGSRSYVYWPDVAKDYDGLIIAPYCWDRRLEGAASAWYYGWDCASGCIWNADAMTALASERVPETV